MQLWFNQQLRLAVGFTLAMAGPAGAEYRPYSIIAEPHDQRAGAITRPAGKPDRDWRRGRRSPEIVTTPRDTATQPRAIADPQRYDARGRRLNVPGRPDTFDAIGRARRDRPAAGVAIAPMGPTVRTDAATRINQFPPR